ncbi:hypothetical protein [Oricola cellulosilytica]|uniref:Lipoprotein n=1 Tax=Oricola cellulosilytica TaxID=1429082 RepID=A0A4R0PB07_9HYPH|nr:hypothetical protein [Oricola cellulosilytica]TCD13485.1 hypothetical protein E0D97_13490 [Oricola cellulosilytica]
MDILNGGLVMHFYRTVNVKSVSALLGLLVLAACQTAKVDDTLGDPDAELTADDLRAYCPRPVLREGTAILRTFTRGNENNPDEIIYQATITDVTRTCRYRDGLLYMSVVAAGRVVNGPKGTTGNLELPVRVAISHGEDLPYSRLGKINVPISPGGGATQFIYKDEQVSVPAPTEPSLQVFVGFDEGPYNTP